ncbi:MAG: hypothetical protein IT442_04270, partial [Phycisphaeraceae bacterium]|nr:hypothetical protein [Phycisphaeraceae bacterium]
MPSKSDSSRDSHADTPKASHAPTADSAEARPRGGNPSIQELLAEAGHKTQSSEFFSPVPPGYQRGRHRYVAVVGTVMSGLGKG